MLETSARLLRVLGILADGRQLSGPELAERLDVTPRTVRSDVERLRSLGYQIEAVRGRAGHYRLNARGSLPPLLLDEEDAVAVAVGLRIAAAAGITGIDEGAALLKLARVLPARLRHRVETLHDATLEVSGPADEVPAEVLTAVATAIRFREGLRFDYPGAEGQRTRREVEPHRLVHTHGRWYLLAWDPSAGDWRLFRVDRLRPRTPGGARFAPRPEPEGGIAGYVERVLGRATWRYRATVRAHAPAAVLQQRLPAAVIVEPIDELHCRLYVGSDDPHQLALWVTMLDAEVEVIDAPELRAALGELAARLARAAGSGPG